MFGRGGGAYLARARKGRAHKRHAGARLRHGGDCGGHVAHRHLRAAHGAGAGVVGAPAADGGRLHAVVHALDGVPDVDLGVVGGVERHPRLHLHLPAGLGCAGRGLRHVAERGCGRHDGAGLPVLFRPHAAPRACQDEPQEHAPDAAQPRLPVPHRVVDAAWGADAGDAHVCGQRHLHALSGRRRRGRLRYSVLLYAPRLHGWQRHSAVGAAHRELQLRRWQLRPRGAGGTPRGAYGGAVRRHRDAGLHGCAAGAGDALPRRSGERCGAYRHRRPALFRCGVRLLRGQPYGDRLQPEP